MSHSTTHHLVAVCVAVCICMAGIITGELVQGLEVDSYVVPPIDVASASYAEWAHEHWVWLTATDENQTSVAELVTNYMSYGIPVGCVDLDSSWESGWSDLVPNTKAYPNISGLIADMKSINVNVIVWATSMIDTDSPNFDYAQKNNFFILNGLNQTGIMKWWHGHGALLDYTNPDAVQWWHSLMDGVFELGISGWKNDGTDPFIMELISPRTSSGKPIQYREYADSYYGDFFDYTREKLGPQALTMSRPVDSPGNQVYLAYSPLRVMTSGWVGDNYGSFVGLLNCAKRVLQSSWRNYANFGCDIDGYKSGNRTQELLLRWAAFSAFLPLMENGGGDSYKHLPWYWDNQPGVANKTLTTDMYRSFVNMHYNILPYLLSIGTTALENETPVIHSIAPNMSTSIFPASFNPPTYDYLLGNNLFISPVILENVTSQTTTFPGQSTAQWLTLFQSPSKVYAGGQTVTFPITLDDSEPYPAFIRAGSIVPMYVRSSQLPHLGDGESWKRSAGIEADDVNSQVRPPISLFVPLTLDSINNLIGTSSENTTSFTVRRFQAQSFEASYNVVVDEKCTQQSFEALKRKETTAAGLFCYRISMSISATLDNASIIFAMHAADLAGNGFDMKHLSVSNLAAANEWRHCHWYHLNSICTAPKAVSCMKKAFARCL